MNERIRVLRENLKLSRAAFGEKIGVSGDVINNLERGRVEAKDHIVKLICAEFRVNERWLRTGDGDMYQRLSKNAEITEFIENMLCNEQESFKMRLVSALARLDADDWKTLENLAFKMLENKD